MRLNTKAAPTMLEYKSDPAIQHVRVPMKATETGGRTFRGFAATWDLDLGGDVITRGAFAKSLAQWRQSGNLIPLIDSHQYGSVLNIHGWLVDPTETNDGLMSGFEVFDDHEGDRVLARVRKRVVTGLSIGYIPIAMREPDARLRELGVRRILDEINVKETSICLSPMNPRAVITSAGKGLAPNSPERLALDARLAALRARVRGGVAPNDPERIKMAERLRALQLGAIKLGIRA